MMVALSVPWLKKRTITVIPCPLVQKKSTETHLEYIQVILVISVHFGEMPIGRSVQEKKKKAIPMSIEKLSKHMPSVISLDIFWMKYSEF